MFTYLKAKNYKSLGNIEFNLLNNKKKIKYPKKLAVIYGENGAGKSNLATIFFTLAETLRTMEIRDVIQSYLENSSSENTKEFIEFIKNNFRDTERIIKANKTINSDENMILEYGFQIGSDRGNYIIEMDDNKIIREELNFKIEKNKGCLFSISQNKVKLNTKACITKSYYDELLLNIEKFWGKHSLLSILINDMNDKAEGYVEKQLNENLVKVIKFLKSFSCRVKVGNRIEKARVGLKYKMLQELEEGKIPITKEYELKNAEELLNEFFTRIYSDIKEVYYKTENIGEEIEYKLYCRKMISDEIRDIDFELESTGTQQLLSLIPYILSAVDGNVVIIDEFDSGIHDLLVKNLLLSINDSIKGQLIMTTHNTMIMESEIEKDALYVIIVDSNGEKSIKCITELEGRVHPNNNVRNRYIAGLYRGIPSMMDIDFEELLDIFE